MDDKNRGEAVAVLFMLVFTVYIEGAILAHKDLEYASSRKLQKLEIGRARHLLHRQRRDATTSPPGDMLSKEVVLNGTEEHMQAYVHWSGKQNSEAVFLLTLKYNQTGVVDSQTWRSRDYGETYSKLNFGGSALITYFYVSPANHSKMVFTDTQNKRLFTSEDEMNSKKTKKLPVAADEIQMHYSESDYMLLYDYSSRQLFVTMDFGTSWHLLKDNVNSRFSWGVKDVDDPKVVHMEYQPEDSEKAYYMRCTIPDCSGAKDGIDYKLGPFMTQTMLVINEYIFVQKSNLDGSDSHMMVSCNRSDFAHAYFPEDIATEDFLVLNADEGQVFLAVNHGDRLGVSLYLSDPKGQNYVLSLARVHHRSAAHWFNVDIHRVQGLFGVFLANQIMNSSDSLTQPRLKSLISLNKGGTWLDIPSPEKNCKSDDCSLLLRLDMANFLHNWILSEENAPGFLIAHGHYGRSYEHDLKNMSVFASVDGGYTWEKCNLTGLYHFNILDQGSLVTAIKTGQDELTNVVHYSSDEGKTWRQGVFGKKNLIIDGVLNEPAINTLAATVYGHENTSAAWTMIKLNFSRVLSRRCNGSDYENWMPSDHDKNLDETCLLGQVTIYRRRQRDKQCNNGEDFHRPKVNKTCACQDEDFECDFGYERVGSVCQKEVWFDNAYLAPRCIAGEKFNVSQGYRKVGSDKCTNGVSNHPQYQKKLTDCPLVAPAHLHVYANVTIVATGKPIHFHLTQKKGSTHNSTQYVWNFNGTRKQNFTGLAAAQSQMVNFTKPGIYYVNVTASNEKGTNTSNRLRVRVEDPVHTVGVFSSETIKAGFPLTITVATNVRSSNLDSSLHYRYSFGDEKAGTRELLTWNASVMHVYSKPGTYVLTVTAVNSVSAAAKQIPISVIDGGVMLQLEFSSNVNMLVGRISDFKERIYMLLEHIRQELSLMLGVNLDRLALNIGSIVPVRVNVLAIPPPASAPHEASAKNIADALIEMAANKSLLLFKSMGLPKSLGDIAVTSVKILNGDSGGGGKDDHKRTGANYRAVYIAIPIVLLAALVTLLVLVYYRRRFRHMRRYNVVSQHEDTDALLDDDEDEPPLDLRSDTRGDSRRDDPMLDLGSGSHLVMVTGNGAGDGAENC